MAWYDTGSVAVTNGSTTVTGTGTNFITGAQVGEAFLAPDDKLYEIASITSATVLVLADAYLGSTQSGQDYKIVPTQSLVADLANDVTDLISDYADVKDKAGAGKFNDGSVTNPAITFEQDQNNGLYRIGSDNWGLVAGGAKALEIKTTGVKLDDGKKITFGASDDLQIYHDGSNSWIQDSGTGSLILKSDGTYTSIQNASGNDQVLVSATDVKLAHSGSAKLATTSTGVDVTGTVTADGLVVNGNTYVSAGNSFTDNTSGYFFSGNGSYDAGVFSTGTTLTTLKAQNNIAFTTVSTERMRINSNGFVGFGTSNPAGAVSISNSTGTTISLTKPSNGQPTIKFNGASSNSVLQGGDVFQIYTGVTPLERMRIDSSGNVGIGTASPSSFNATAAGEKLVLGDGSSSSAITVYTNSASSGSLGFADGTTGTAQYRGLIQYQHGTDSMVLYTGGTERARIDSSGNLLVGTTSTYNTIAFANSADGTAIDSGGKVAIANTDGEALSLNRRTGASGDIGGDLALFRINGISHGSVGTVVNDGSLYIKSANTGIGMGSTAVFPVSGSGVSTDNTRDLGAASIRWDDVYATNGTIQTSDRNEKQDIEVLSDAEQRVAQACKGLLRKFRWQDSVEEKGDDARIHFGIIAQDLQDAFTAEGLDAGRYAMFISTTWTDEETGEERTRLGVRYPELLAFIISAI